MSENQPPVGSSSTTPLTRRKYRLSVPAGEPGPTQPRALPRPPSQLVSATERHVHRDRRSTLTTISDANNDYDSLNGSVSTDGSEYTEAELYSRAIKPAGNLKPVGNATRMPSSASRDLSRDDAYFEDLYDEKDKGSEGKGRLQHQLLTGIDMEMLRAFLAVFVSSGTTGGLMAVLIDVAVCNSIQSVKKEWKIEPSEVIEIILYNDGDPTITLRNLVWDKACGKTEPQSKTLALDGVWNGMILKKQFSQETTMKWGHKVCGRIKFEVAVKQEGRTEYAVECNWINIHQLKEIKECKRIEATDLPVPDQNMSPIYEQMVYSARAFHEAMLLSGTPNVLTRKKTADEKLVHVEKRGSVAEGDKFSDKAIRLANRHTTFLNTAL